MAMGILRIRADATCLLLNWRATSCFDPDMNDSTDVTALTPRKSSNSEIEI
jgi:hypothetical protein